MAAIALHIYLTISYYLFLKDFFLSLLKFFKNQSPLALHSILFLSKYIPSTFQYSLSSNQDYLPGNQDSYHIAYNTVDRLPAGLLQSFEGEDYLLSSELLLHNQPIHG